MANVYVGFSLRIHCETEAEAGFGDSPRCHFAVACYAFASCLEIHQTPPNGAGLRPMTLYRGSRLVSAWWRKAPWASGPPSLYTERFRSRSSSTTSYEEEVTSQFQLDL